MRDAAFWRTPMDGKHLGRRERKKLETGRRIYREAMELFREKGFNATTIDEIAREADVAKGTVFNYFPQKTAFLTTSYQIWFARMMEDLGPVGSWKGSVSSQFCRVFDYLTELTVEHRALSRLVIFESMRQAHLRMGRRMGEAPGSALEGTAKPPEEEGILLLESVLREILNKGKATAEIRGEVGEDHAASLIAGMAFQSLVRGLVKGSSVGEMQGAMKAKLDIIITGLAP